MENTGSYKALGDIDAIRARPGMYIGSVETADHLVTEVIDNMLDEVANGYANNCSLFFGKDNHIWVTDNGRGIEVYEMTLPDGKVEDSVVALCTVTHSGSKFDTSDYSTLIGMHGVGLVAVNALSEWVIVQTRDRSDKSKYHKYTFNNAILTSKEYDLDYPESENWSTVIGFKPDIQYFESDTIDLRKIIQRLLLAQSKIENSQFWINGKELPKKTFEQYIQDQLGYSDDDQIYKLQYDSFTFDNKWNGSIVVYLTYTQDPETIVQGDVNLRTCDGTYLTSFQTLLKNVIGSKLDKKFKDVSEVFYLLGLKLYISLTVPEPQFDSQTKSRMTLNVKGKLIDPLKSQVEWFLDRGNILSIITSNVERKLKQNLVKVKTVKGKGVNPKNKIKDAIKIPGDVLYILEGDSACGTMQCIRNPDIHGLFPLRGKMLNVESSSIDKFQNNKEIKDLLEGLGPKSKRRYKKIKLLADADPDGHHIVVLLLLFMQKFADDYIKSGNLSVVLPPLYGATKGKNYVPIYNEADLNYYRSQNWDVYRFKGIGEMEPEEMEMTLKSNMEYVVQWPLNAKELTALINIVTDTSVKRSIMNDKRCTVNRIVQEVVSVNNL